MIPPRFTVVSEADAEKADAVICMRIGSMKRIFTDDIETVCARCGHGIFHRPHAPKAPPKVCLECMTAETVVKETTQ